MRHWMKTCKDVHGSDCDPVKPSPDGPQWLVDVRRNCIAMASEGAEYATLSYVWGRPQAAFDTSCLNLRNYFQLQVPGNLDSERFQLSPAIRQAMQLTKELGIQYLWVDKVCIAQDGHMTKQQQLDAMAAIYAGSCLTIIAAYEQNEDWDFRQPPIRNNTPEHYAMMKWQCQRLMRSNWYSRGWTFQEHTFARRMIIFQDNTYNWECHCTSWQEAQGMIPRSTQQRCSRPRITVGSTLNPLPFPDLYRFSRLIEIYNQRTLTFPEDGIDAFAGALSDLGKIFPGGFVAGTPVLFFDAMLTWQPLEPVTKRIKGKAGTNIDEPLDPLPSWSWVGWQGTIDIESLRSAGSYLRNPSENSETTEAW
ncbi:HET-domain-containing protein, partial [Lophiostoma macrostomum CBS 122681]